MSYAEVLLPLPLAGTFIYSVPSELTGSVKPGHRVIVPFGRKKFYTGIVVALSPVAPEGGYEVKKVSRVLDDGPVVRHPQLKFWGWLSDYYLCTPGEVYKAAVPAGLKIESETVVDVNPDFEETISQPLNEREAIVFQTVSHADKRVSLANLERSTGLRNVQEIVQRLLDRGALIISENLVERYRVRKETFVSLAIGRGDSKALHTAFDSVHGAPRQEKALMTLIDLSYFMRRDEPLREVSRRELLDRSGVTTPIIAALEKKGIVRLWRKEVSRFSPVTTTTIEPPELTEYQAQALRQIHESWRSHSITLLHGVTSSGKTEVYISLIRHVLELGRQILYLVPEIALTTQLTQRLQRVFGDKVIIYHSRFSDNERVELWRKMLHTNDPVVVIGARSAVFLPFASLGLVIVDEEHESSFKQQDPAPRYNGRDAAIVLAHMHGAKTLLGSATPAIDTYYKALSGRYGLVTLDVRYGGASLPEVELIDMSISRKKHEVSGPFSRRLHDLVTEAKSEGHQSILFLNRRGFAPMARCKMCGYVPKCENCDVSLTYHHGINRLVCHYCGTPYELPRECPACKQQGLEIIGYGTERIEEELAGQFPDMSIARLDRDTTRDKEGYENIIAAFSKGKNDILVGTQMVTKGLDFDNVSIVGVVNADSTVNMPDFRASERAFNMLEQVAGRAGRRNNSGIVAVQTYNVSHPIFSFLQAHDYKGFYNHEIEERRLFNYPPFTRLIYIYLKHRDQNVLDSLSATYSHRLRQLFGNRVFGPDQPSVARVQQLYIRRIMLKIEVDASMKKVKEIMRATIGEMHAAGTMKGAFVYYDVDPM